MAAGRTSGGVDGRIGKGGDDAKGMKMGDEVVGEGGGVGKTINGVIAVDAGVAAHPVKRDRVAATAKRGNAAP